MSNPIQSKGVNKNTETKLFLGAAALALGQAVQSGDGHLTPTALVWLTIALICSGASVVSQRRSFPPISTKELRFVLTIGLIWQIFQLITTLPGIYMLPEALSRIWVFKTGIAIAGSSALLSLAPDTWLSQRVKTGLAGLAISAIFCSGMWVIQASPSPFIDTFAFQQTSSEALLNGQNPYGQSLPNIYGSMDFYGEELVQEGKMTIGNPYPPLSIYLSFLGYLAGGDIRYSHLVAIILAGVLIAFFHPSRETLLITYIYLFTPRVFFVLEQAWTEPLVVFLVAVVLWYALKRPTWVPVALGLTLASKQYLIFMLPVMLLLFLWKLSWRRWTKNLGLMLGAAFAATAPLAFWNLPAFLWNVGLAQWYQVFRIDALSYLALYSRVTDQFPSQFLPFIALAGAFWFTWRFASRSPTGFAISLAFCLGIFFAFNKQAFCNYYFLVIGVLCGAFAMLPTDNEGGFPEKTTDGQLNIQG